MKTVKLVALNLLALLVFGFNINQSNACTGIRLTAGDGSVVYGRSMEWGTFDLNSRVATIPRGHSFTGLTPDGNNGKKWKGKYAVVGLDMLHKDYLADGMNEKGLAVGLFYHPGFASYMEYKPSMAEETITAVNIVNFILSQFASVEEVRAGMKTVQVVPVIEKALGIPVNAHWIVTDATGISIVIEFTDGQLKIHENPLGVITNAPNYDWHMTNLRNYVNLSAVAIPDKKIEELDFTPIGGGSGMIGLPGDFTPPSRFVRAVAWTQTARPTAKSEETIYELFRILDNFNLPLGSAEGSNNAANLEGMRSSTIWTTAWDLTERVLYYHTQHNRRIRKLDLKKIDFSKQAHEIVHIPLDDKKEQDIKEISFRK
ncbi:choloylglycine hydrolase [bacterium endosymbiont of Escarpia laminata]|nr:MAG: choloylglycine hydrolase [bacterium endosymbiont of Escarpia laminata]